MSQRLADFDYELPDRLIARHPPPERRDSRLLAVDRTAGTLEDRAFADLPGLLRAGDILVLNDTRVVRARLRGQKATGGRVEVLVERPISDRSALVHLKASKSPGPGARLILGDGLAARVIARRGPFFELEFDRPVNDALQAFGSVPLPPYLGRDAESADDERYQTVYARAPGAVAAPTAGLHFDAAMFDELRAAGIEHTFVTLHVGAGTFQNLRHERVDDNRLHAERATVSAAAVEKIEAAREAGGRVVAVGTTAVRTLEAAAGGGRLAPFEGETELFIRPGYRFACVDALLTNFHLPRSSLLMLVSAFAGREQMLAAYRHAVAHEYRFFSYGDAMLIAPGAGP